MIKRSFRFVAHVALVAIRIVVGLVAAGLISYVGFLLWPSHFSWSAPHVARAVGSLFAWLAAVVVGIAPIVDVERGWRFF